ncbi:hypothetical protein EVAR_78717_1 [Eumeta japonica]|uniref:Uncharacterized protein n=1 Tax=Eumeta variegata TaxID=151549 RepID=A0A4C1T205_EUMVA|nr:hypothetical protein EVAR_78717_1 [Eumeta japonica]
MREKATSTNLDPVASLAGITRAALPFIIAYLRAKRAGGPPESTMDTRNPRNYQCFASLLGGNRISNREGSRRKGCDISPVKPTHYCSAAKLATARFYYTLCYEARDPRSTVAATR